MCSNALRLMKRKRLSLKREKVSMRFYLNTCESALWLRFSKEIYASSVPSFFVVTGVKRKKILVTTYLGLGIMRQSLAARRTPL